MTYTLKKWISDPIVFFYDSFFNQFGKFQNLNMTDKAGLVRIKSFFRKYVISSKSTSDIRENS